MANHSAAALLLLIASLVVAVALSGADARLTARHNAAALLRDADNVRHTGPNTVTVSRDANGGYVLVEKKAAAPPAAAPELTCNKVHGVQSGETCFSVSKGVGLSQDQFLGFNPNINCENLFIGQWVCLEATTA